MPKEITKTKLGKYIHLVFKARIFFIGVLRLSLFYYKGFRKYKEVEFIIPLIGLHIKFKYPEYNVKYTFRIELNKGWEDSWLF